MRLHRFYFPEHFSPGPRFVFNDARIVRQVRSVLRLKAQDQFILFDGSGEEYVCKIEKLGKTDITLQVVAVQKNDKESPIKTTLYLAILKNEHFDLVVQKSTEAGVIKIVPVLTERTVKQSLKLGRLRAIAEEAAEQSGRGIVPEVCNPISLQEALEESQKSRKRNLFFTLGGPLIGISQEAEDTGIFIGPEGGWTDDEEAMAKQYRCVTAGLGALTLRAETAAIVATYLVSHQVS